MAATGYYQQHKGAFPDFAQYYAWSGWTTRGGVMSVARSTADINRDGKDDLVLALWQGKSTEDSGKVSDSPTPNRILIFLSQSDGTYRDATAQLLGISGALELDGGARNISSGDLNNDGQADFGFSLSREDGRAGEPPSNSNAQSALLLSLPSGGYKIVNVGNADWSQVILITNFNGKGHLYFQGFTGSNSTFFYGNATDGQVNSGVDYVLNSSGTDLIVSSRPPISGSGLVVMPPSAASPAQTVIVSDVRDQANNSIVALSVQGLDGKWSIAATLQPYKMTTVPYVTWQGTKGTGSLASVDDSLVTGITYDAYDLLPALYPGSSPVAVLRLSAATIKGPRSDGFYYQNDGVPFSKLQFYQTDGNQLKPAPIKIVNEDVNRNINFIEFLDLTKCGLQDIIVYPYWSLGAPIVYLNTGAGLFFKADGAAFPVAPPAWGGNPDNGPATSKFLDANGDGIFDLVYWPSNGVSPPNSPYPSTADNTPLSGYEPVPESGRHCP